MDIWNILPGNYNELHRVAQRNHRALCHPVVLWGFQNALTTRLRENHQSLNPGWLIGFLTVAGDPSVIEPLGNFGLRIGDFGML